MEKSLTSLIQYVPIIHLDKLYRSSGNQWILSLKGMRYVYNADDHSKIIDILSMFKVNDIQPGSKLYIHNKVKTNRDKLRDKFSIVRDVNKADVIVIEKFNIDYERAGKHEDMLFEYYYLHPGDSMKMEQYFVIDDSWTQIMNYIINKSGNIKIVTLENLEKHYMFDSLDSSTVSTLYELINTKDKTNVEMAIDMMSMYDPVKYNKTLNFLYMHGVQKSNDFKKLVNSRIARLSWVNRLIRSITCDDDEDDLKLLSLVMLMHVKEILVTKDKNIDQSIIDKLELTIS